MERRRWLRGLVLVLGLVLACETGGGEGAADIGGGEGLDSEVAELLGIWVSDDEPGSLWVMELLPYDPYREELAGKAQVYRLWTLPDGAAPVLRQLGTFAIDDGELLMHVVWSTEGHAGLDFANRINAGEGDYRELESAVVAGGWRHLNRVATFPGGDYVGGDTTPIDAVAPGPRVRVGATTADYLEIRAHLFRTGPTGALAVLGASWPNLSDRLTLLDWQRTTDAGATWTTEGDGRLGSYQASGVRFKDQVDGRPLVFPDDTLSEYLYLWNPVTEVWDRDNDVQVCRLSAGFRDADVALRGWNDLAWSACEVDGEAVAIHRRYPQENSLRVAYITSPVEHVATQWAPAKGPHGTLFVLVHTGDPARPLTLYAHEEVPSRDFDETGFALPAATLVPSCGAAACALTDIVAYYVAGEVHHIIASATLDGLAPAHPLAPPSELALHIHGRLGEDFTTEVLNLRDGKFLGDLVDVDLPEGCLGEDAPLFATFQTPGCLRVLRSPGAGVDWAPFGEVPTTERPLAGAIVIWGERLEMMNIGTQADVFSLPFGGSCPPPRRL